MFVVDFERYSKEMENKSIIIGLPIVPFNQSKHSDVCKYLEYIQELVKEIYGKDDKGSYQIIH